MPNPDFVYDDDDEDEVTGGGIPDDDGWIHLKGKQSDADAGTGDSGGGKAAPKVRRVAVRRKLRTKKSSS